MKSVLRYALASAVVAFGLIAIGNTHPMQVAAATVDTKQSCPECGPVPPLCPPDNPDCDKPPTPKTK